MTVSAQSPVIHHHFGRIWCCQLIAKVRAHGRETSLTGRPFKCNNPATNAAYTQGSPLTGGSVELFGQTVSVGNGMFLLLALALALSFEFVNGFHDTANAVATVIYTHTLKPTVAVVWSGCWNLIGVLTSGGGVAFGVLALLPVELVLNVGSSAGFAMVFSLLLAAIIWNLGTWYLGLPASSSHALIGSIMGVGIANAMAHGQDGTSGVDWAQATNVGKALLFSPIVGFVVSALLLLV